MDDVLESRPRELKHVQVREYVRSLVEGAEAGSPAPSERELVTRFGVARMTVRQAMDTLVAEGLLERMPGKGTFVAHPQRRASRPVGFTEEMLRRGFQPESQTLLTRLEQAGPGVARALDITPGDSVLHWRRLRRADGAPVCLQDAFLNEVLLPGFLEKAMPTSLYGALVKRGLAPHWAEDSISAGLADETEARLLEVEPESAVLRVSRRAVSGEVTVEVSRSTYRPDRFTMFVQVGAPV
ncbi:MAG: GntR family transcriptional regulator [Nocardioides sp.]|uniref:GntR family transcriptional regulator n=1 Tax=Nocardioides sp. TaxID=35761 RepID=UPI0039E41854